MRLRHTGALSRVIVSYDVDRLHGRGGTLRDRVRPPRDRPRCVYVNGLFLSPDNFLRDLKVWGEVNGGAPEPGILLLYLLHPFGLADRRSQHS